MCGRDLCGEVSAKRQSAAGEVTGGGREESPPPPQAKPFSEKIIRNDAVLAIDHSVKERKRVDDH